MESDVVSASRNTEKYFETSRKYLTRNLSLFSDFNNINNFLSNNVWHHHHRLSLQVSRYHQDIFSLTINLLWHWWTQSCHVQVSQLQPHQIFNISKVLQQILQVMRQKL